MADVKHQFNPDEAEPYSSNFPARVKNNGTNFPVTGLAFDAATDEACVLKFIADDYGSSNPNITLDLLWYADAATSGDVVWESQISAISPNADAQDIETDGLATANSVTDSHLGTTGQRLHKATITITNIDNLDAGDLVHLRIARDANNASDTMTGDAILVMVEVTYSDT